MAITITAAEQDSYPPRVLLTVSGLTAGVDVVELRRVVSGVAETMRDGGIAAAAAAETVLDAELPFGVPVSWQVLDSPTGVVLDTDGPLTVTLPGGKVALSDAISGVAAEVVILSWPSRDRTAVASVFVADNRNIVVSAGLGQYTATVALFTETTAAAVAVGELLETCTSGIVQVRQAGGYDGVDAYWGILAASDERFSQDGSDQRRIWTLQVASCERWAPPLEARGYTLQDLADLYAGLTLTDLDADFLTLLAVAQADLT